MVGVSGGADSVALFAGLRELGFSNLVACHFNHGLRPADAQGEREAVEHLAGRANCLIGSGDTAAHANRHQCSIETAARELRMAFFHECAEATGSNQLLLAHHARDQAETILMNLCRGAGPAGLGGMHKKSILGKLQVFRPLLETPPEALRRYLAERRLRFVEDPSNESLEFTRNRFRHLVLPAIAEAAGDGAIGALLRSADILREVEEFMRGQTPRLPAHPRVGELKSLHPAILSRAIRDWLRRGGVPEVGAGAVDRVIRLLDMEAGPAKVSLPGGWHARRRSGTLFLEEQN